MTSMVGKNPHAQVTGGDKGGGGIGIPNVQCYHLEGNVSGSGGVQGLSGPSPPGFTVTFTRSVAVYSTTLHAGHWRKTPLGASCGLCGCVGMRRFDHKVGHSTIYPPQTNTQVHVLLL